MKDMLFITSQKNWKRGDWIEMVGKVFEIMPHKFGPFRQWTEPNLGHVSFMNDAENIRVQLSADLHYLSSTSIRIFVQHRDGQSVGTTLEFQGQEDFKRMPADIVETVYDMIDNPENYGDQGFDNYDTDPQPEHDPDPSESLPVGSPVFAGWKWNYKEAGMTYDRRLLDRVAQLLKMRPEEVDPQRLQRAISSVNRKDQDYYDALANADQLHGNIPFEVAVALVY